MDSLNRRKAIGLTAAGLVTFASPALTRQGTRREDLPTPPIDVLVGDFPKRVSAALCLCMDLSRSMVNENRHPDLGLTHAQLQFEGTAQALKSDRVKAVILDVHKGIAACTTHFSAEAKTAQSWHYLDTEAKIDQFANEIATGKTPIHFPAATLIANGINHSRGLFKVLENNGVKSNKRVIDISCDGTSDDHLKELDVQRAVLEAARSGIRVNALAMPDTADPTLYAGRAKAQAAYLSDCAITTPEMYHQTGTLPGEVWQVLDMAQFAQAMEKKLVSELVT